MHSALQCSSCDKIKDIVGDAAMEGACRKCCTETESEKERLFDHAVLIADKRFAIDDLSSQIA